MDEDLRWPRAHPSLRREVKNSSPNSPLTLVRLFPVTPCEGHTLTVRVGTGPLRTAAGETGSSAPPKSPSTEDIHSD